MDLIIGRKNLPYYKIVLTTPLAIYVAIKSLISNINSTREWRIAIIIFLVIFLLMCFSFFINAIIQILKKTPAIKLDDKGITDNISIVKGGFIEWENIVGCEIKKYTGTNHLILYLKDYSEIIINKTGVKGKMAENIIKNLGTPIIFNLSLIDINPNELEKAIKEKIK